MRDKYTEDICHSATLEGYFCVNKYISTSNSISCVINKKNNHELTDKAFSLNSLQVHVYLDFLRFIRSQT